MEAADGVIEDDAAVEALSEEEAHAGESGPQEDNLEPDESAASEGMPEGPSEASKDEEASAGKGQEEDNPEGFSETEAG